MTWKSSISNSFKDNSSSRQSNKESCRNIMSTTQCLEKSSYSKTSQISLTFCSVCHHTALSLIFDLRIICQLSQKLFNETSVCTTECSTQSNICQNGGTVNPIPINGQCGCQCPARYTGLYCDTAGEIFYFASCLNLF